MMNWNQPICTFCWYAKNPGRTPVTIKDDGLQRCSYCGGGTSAGIYVRAHPDTVPYPAAEESEGS